MSEELDKSRHGGRAANVWTALTMRALQSLQAEAGLSASKECLPSTGSARAESVISKVFSALSPLISSSQTEALRVDLLALVNSAIEVWDNAQTGELRLVVSQSLNRAHREDWRSKDLDPVSPSGNRDETDSDLMSQTHPRIFTLFPHVVAKGVADLDNCDTGPPGSWPPESDQTCIHPGKGLPEWSALVVRGKMDQEEKKDFLSQAFENAKKELQSAKRISGQGRRESRGSATSEAPNPSEQWKKEGTMKFVEY